jgi:hypothetical protein
MQTISVRLDDGSEARLDNLCQTLSLSQSEVVKDGLALPLCSARSSAVTAIGPGVELVQHRSLGSGTTPSPSRKIQPCRPLRARTIRVRWAQGQASDT